MNKSLYFEKTHVRTPVARWVHDFKKVDPIDTNHQFNPTNKQRHDFKKVCQWRSTASFYQTNKVMHDFKKIVPIDNRGYVDQSKP